MKLCSVFPTQMPMKSIFIFDIADRLAFASDDVIAGL